MSTENYKEMLDDSSLYNLELEKNRIQDRLNSSSIYESIKNIDKQKSLCTIAESIYKEIEKLPINSEFKIAQFFKDYNIEENDKFDLCKQVISYCIVNNVKIIEKFPDADLGLSWNIPRIKK